MDGFVRDRIHNPVGLESDKVGQGRRRGVHLDSHAVVHNGVETASSRSNRRRDGSLTMEGEETQVSERGIRIAPCRGIVVPFNPQVRVPNNAGFFPRAFSSRSPWGITITFAPRAVVAVRPRGFI